MTELNSSNGRLLAILNAIKMLEEPTHYIIKRHLGYSTTFISSNIQRLKKNKIITVNNSIKEGRNRCIYTQGDNFNKLYDSLTQVVKLTK